MENINDYQPNEFVKYILHHLNQHSSVITSCLLLLDEKSLTIEDKANILGFIRASNDKIKTLENEIKVWLDTNDN
jgi:hypothetical protein